jgi:ubiquinone/menaquinone biosynthesis C-methylase UbiE
VERCASLVADLGPNDQQEITRQSPERYDPTLHQGMIIAAEHQTRYRWAATVAAGKQVLDAGCGAGYGTAMLAQGGASRVIGLDVDPSTITAAAERYGHPDEVDFVVGDLRELPFAAASFDQVVCFEAIEHVERQEAAMDELRRVLRDEGHLLLSSPNRDVFPPGNPHHVHEYTPQELERALRERFVWVELWRQHTWLTSLLVNDLDAVRGPDDKLEIEARKLNALRPGSELYTLAVAGGAPLHGLRNGATLCEPLEIRELVMREAKAQQDLRQRTDDMYRARQETADAIAGYERSFSWRVTKPLRAVKRVVSRR